MRLSVAANYDPELVPQFQPYPVKEVFGKLPADFMGGGRPSYLGGGLKAEQLRDYVAVLRRHGIAFNYLLNASCLGNREWTHAFQKQLARWLEQLQRWGISRLTVSTPFLLRAIKARFPEFSVKVGLNAQVDCLRKAQFWEELGADAIILECRTLNRNLPRLAEIRKAVRCDLHLIANHPCLPACPMHYYHQNGYAHSSDGSGTLFLDYCFFHCSRLRLEEPANLIKATWIRPEDVTEYERLGFGTFKILERGIPSAELLRRVKAYSERRFAGNLAEILLPYGFNQEVKRERFWVLRYFFRPWQVKPWKLLPLYRLIKQQGMLYPLTQNPFRIDSTAIPADFLAGFENRDCASLSCQACGYCESIARMAVRVDAQFRAEALPRLAAAEAALVGGSLWDA